MSDVRGNVTINATVSSNSLRETGVRGAGSFERAVSIFLKRLTRTIANPTVAGTAIVAIAMVLYVAKVMNASDGLTLSFAVGTFCAAAMLYFLTRAKRFPASVYQTIALAACAIASWQFVSLPAAREVSSAHLRVVWPAAALALAAAVAVGIIYWARRRPAMGFHHLPLEVDFAGRDDLQIMRNLFAQLRHHLDLLDSQTDWHASTYVPLEAEVDVFRGDRGAARVVDLYEGLRQNVDSRLFVVLGDPGSGKSVSLRKLARDLLAEGELSGRIPVYVNLKEWRPARSWKQSEYEPTNADIATFILDSLRSRLILNSNSWDFVRDNFQRLLDMGRLFLILDSFDEIPQLLDSRDASWLIRSLSNIVSDLITGSADGRGIVASRLFRQPVITRENHCRLDIRPLSDAKVSRLIDAQAGPIGGTVKRAVFSNRPDLAPVGRNPLLLTLLVEYVKRHGALPPNQYAMFRSHMDWNVREALMSPDYRDLNSGQIWLTTELIAHAMFKEESFGLEMPLDVLRKRMPESEIDRVVGFLQHARLGRLTSPGLVFSFVHRRFNEFFLVHWLREDPQRARARASTIPADGRWRDALTLYAEVATDSDAIDLAAYCFAESLPLRLFQCAPGDPAYDSGLHSLRFLVDAFRGRRVALSEIARDLSAFVGAALARDDILVRKNAVEAIGILPTRNANILIGRALVSGDVWVRETAFRACRYLPSLSGKVLTAARRYLLGLSAAALLRRYSELQILLSLSEPFRSLRKALPARGAEAILGFVLPFAVFLVEPIVFFWTVVCYATLAAMAIAFYGRDFGRGGFLNYVGIYQLRSVLGPVVAFYTLVTTLAYVFGSRLQDPAPSELTFFHVVGLAPPGAPPGANHMLFGLLGPVPQEIGISATALPAFNMSLLLLCFPFAALTLAAGKAGFRGDLAVIFKGIRILIKFARRSGEFRPREVASAVLFAIVLCGAIIAILLLLGRWMDGHPAAVRWTAAAIASVLAIIISSRLAHSAYRRIHDWRRLLFMRRSPPSTRVQIAVALEAFLTRPGREAFVKWLASQSQLSDVLRHPDDKWPENSRPNYDNDDASALLAQLEERWLGLAR